MVWTIYFIILGYFILGFVGFFFINRKKNKEEVRGNWIKYVTYALIIHLLFFTIIFAPLVFTILAFLIVGGSLFEMIRIARNSNINQSGFFIVSLCVLILFSVGFLMFSTLPSNLVLFTFLIVSIFDSFSQIAGQIWGRRKLFRKISPQKTIEGFLGGIVIALLSSYLLRELLAETSFLPMRLATGIIAFSFLGDMAASYYKRRYHVKDFSAIIPGHGGFLDRFDSLMGGGAFVMLSQYFLT